MRKFKFRGRDLSTGKFVFGDLETRPKEDIMVIHQYNEDGSYKSQVKVDQNTVGQYVYSRHVPKDNCVREIFEGDILRGRQPYEDGTHIGFVEYDERAQRYKLHTKDNHLEELVVFSIVEILGNIYDNPEIIENK